MPISLAYPFKELLRENETHIGLVALYMERRTKSTFFYFFFLQHGE
jgi:hypothetical protein